MSGQAPLDSFSTGTLAGAGCFRCGTCGFAVALHERDEVPACPHCGGEDFRRSSIFGELEPREPADAGEVESPDWLTDAREAVEREGDYLAFDEDGQLRVVELEGGWTRIGRSLAADIRFDDPTVSRRHAMLHRAEGVARVLDDRSLNGVFVNGDRVDMRTLSDGDELTIGRFRLYFLSLTEVGVRDRGMGVPGAFA
jgi:predicted  nucleic acid-binding Zn-ribbon protein